MKLVLFLSLVSFLQAEASGQKNELGRYKPLRSNNVEWTSFKKKFNKIYESHKVESDRKAIFMENLNEMKKHNRRYEKGEESFFMGVNDLTDRGFHEKRNYTFGEEWDSEIDELQQPTNFNSFIIRPSLPVNVDWRRHGVVTHVKSQGECYSSWAFATTGVIESHYAIKVKKNAVALSEQALIDCAWSAGNRGCYGGTIRWALRYILRRPDRGIPTEDSYKYYGYDRQCRKFGSIGAQIDGFKLVEPGNNLTELKIIINKGPIAVSIQVGYSFDHYAGGIYECSGLATQAFSVLIVGYKNIHGTSVLIVKNSRGTYWGVAGYVFIKMDGSENCFKGNNIQGIYPLV